jgi:hypothetical protein
MSGRVHVEVKATPRSSFSPVRSGLFAGSHGTLLVSQPPMIQAKLTINQPNDQYEQEADRVAEEVMRMPEPRLQRQVEPEEEKKAQELIQAKQTSGQTPQVSRILETQIHSLRGGGQLLSPSLRNFFEPRFGYDFSQVRIHTDSEAARISQSINARAFTLGQTILFGKGQYKPEKKAGQWLLAHELTHVVQQNQRKVSRTSAIVRLRTSTENYAQCAYYTKNELVKYLDFLEKEGKIEDKSDSDDKAIAVVHWSESPNRPRFYSLGKKIKALLILEMLKEFTGDEEEQAILELLERSNNSDLIYIMTTGGVTVEELESNFHGKEFQWLKDFFERRFEGGWIAALKGQMKPKGIPIRKRLPLQAVFPEREKGETVGEKEIKLRKYIELIDVRFTEVRPISNLAWLFGEEGLKKRFEPLKDKEEYKFDAGTARITYNTKEEETIEVSGGALHPIFKTHRTGSKEVVITSKAGASYVNSYGEPMPYASFFYGGQAFHGCGNRNWFINIFAPVVCLSTPSHGCIHVDNDVMENIYPYIVANKTKVRIK